MEILFKSRENRNEFSMALIYNNYEAGIRTSDGNKNYKCLVCVSLKEKSKDGSDFYSIATGTTTFSGKKFFWTFRSKIFFRSGRFYNK